MKVRYEDYLEEFKEIRKDDKAVKHTEEVIIIDVQRSFLIHKDFDQKVKICLNNEFKRANCEDVLFI